MFNKVIIEVWKIVIYRFELYSGHNYFYCLLTKIISLLLHSDYLMFTEWSRKGRRVGELWWADVARQALFAPRLCGTKVWRAAADECHTGWQTTKAGRLAGQVQRATATCRQSIQFVVVVVCCELMHWCMRYACAVFITVESS